MLAFQKRLCNSRDGDANGNQWCRLEIRSRADASIMLLERSSAGKSMNGIICHGG